ncbi:MAG TPA: hypothetical protein VG294_14005 [Solirubrobacteraceae bacterium]|jgi:hypothetical protein|nr:hypothetical protein [Solirubrobacteraceae bacterium]
MRLASISCVAVSVLALAVGAGGAAATGPFTGTAGQQTHPYVSPRAGGPHAHFYLHLTLAVAPGHAGVVATDYQLQVKVPPAQPVARCSPRAPAIIDTGIAHQSIRIGLIAPAAGWCRGRYTVTVFLQRGPYCPKPAPGQPPAACPEFATQELGVGSTHFTVTGGH